VSEIVFGDFVERKNKKYLLNKKYKKFFFENFIVFELIKNLIDVTLISKYI